MLGLQYKGCRTWSARVNLNSLRGRPPKGRGREETNERSAQGSTARAQFDLPPLLRSAMQAIT